MVGRECLDPLCLQSHDLEIWQIGGVQEPRDYSLLECYAKVRLIIEDRMKFVGSLLARSLSEAQRLAGEDGVVRPDVREDNCCTTFRNVLPLGRGRL